MKMYDDSILEWMKSPSWKKVSPDCGCRGRAMKERGDKEFAMCVGSEIVTGEFEAK